MAFLRLTFTAMIVVFYLSCVELSTPTLKPEPLVCGGLVGFPCPSGFVCNITDIDVADASGVCVRNICGGIAGFQCPFRYRCVITKPYPDALGKCVSDPIYGQFCGGIATIQCPKGYLCLIRDTIPDAGGMCIPE